MSNVVFPRMGVLQSLYELTADITHNRFITTRPSSTDKSMQEFLLIRLPQSMDPWGDACQFTTMQISVFARDVQGGLENTFTLDKLQNEVMALFGDKGVINTSLFTAWEPRLLPGGSDGAGFHSLIIQSRLQIK